jgi:hypothetical protein
VVNQSYTQTLASSGGTTPLSWAIDSGSLPPGIALNSTTGQLSGVPSASGTYTFTAKLTDSLGANATRAFDLVIADILTIATSSLSDGSVNTSYSVALTASGGTVPYTWAIIAGVLPSGVSINENTGLLSGIPTESGVFYFVGRVTDYDGHTATKTFSLTISDLNIASATLADGTIDTAYTATLQASGGNSPYTWVVINGTLPPGIGLESDTGVISGTPTAAGSYGFTVRVTDAGGKTASKTLSILVAAPATGETTTTTEGDNNEGCFIATAAYGSYLDPHVMALRRFRDGILLTNPAGGAFVRFYYRHSPPVADFIRRHEALRTATRIALTPVVFAVEYPAGPGIVLMGVVLVGLSRRRKSA